MIEKIIDIVIHAGKEVLKIYTSSESFEIFMKQDNSPLTIADKVSNRILLDGIQSISTIPIISEENKKIFKSRKEWNKFWLVDPLDGTKEFIKRNGEFTINIALIENGKPILGVVYAPVKDLLYFAFANEAYKKKNNSISKLELGKETRQVNKIRAVVSRSHLNESTLRFLSHLKMKTGKNIEKVSVGSSLKICYIAEGKADIYPRFVPTMEWDTAAAHAILSFSGGKLVTVDKNLDNFFKNSELRYNKETLKNPPFVAFNPYVF